MKNLFMFIAVLGLSSAAFAQEAPKTEAKKSPMHAKNESKMAQKDTKSKDRPDGKSDDKKEVKKHDMKKHDMKKHDMKKHDMKKKEATTIVAPVQVEPKK